MFPQNLVRFGLFAFFCAAFGHAVFAQEVRPRTVNTVGNLPRVTTNVQQRPVGKPVLTNDLLVRPTAAVRPVNAPSANAASASSAAFRTRLLSAMSERMGKRYVYGSTGPNTYDCSGLVWSVFNAAGIPLERTSAATMWNTFPAATETEKTQFGTLVFFNHLAHVGIVIDENTFYQASSSQGVTISKFAGYWEKRIVGYRRVPLNQISNFVK